VKQSFCNSVLAAALLALAPTFAHAVVLDGANIPGEGLTLRATQDTPTGFGNATGGGQDSAGGSELNALYADIDGGVLTIGITGNLEGNFNKFFLFIDAVPGGENVLANDNVDGGFNEINNMAGLAFAGGATMDHGLRFEIGGGFYGVRQFDLINNTGGDVATGGGPGDLPLAGVGSGGITVGWNNSNVLGVDGASAAGALSATTGWEISIDLVQAYGFSQGDINLAMVVTNGDAGFLSNQSLPGLNGAGNLGSGNGQTLPIVTVPGSPVPEPGAVALCGLAMAGLASIRRQG
jgi:hypothetical protein